MMLTIVDFRRHKAAYPSLVRSKNSTSGAEEIVSHILQKVKTNGDDALRYYSKKIDRVKITHIKVPQKEIIDARRHGDKGFISILIESAKNIRKFHEQQRRKNWKIKVGSASELQQVFRPIQKVGVYVPGGKAAYPSTVLMNVIPALVAGVKDIHLVSPPDKNGKIHPDVLLAASLLGIKNIYRVGGAQAIAALAYGTKSIPAVDKIVGPGNIFVAMAKRMVYGIVGIDSFAGPSEVVILADHSADPLFVASDLLAQAEHDENASSILVTTSVTFAKNVLSELNNIVVGLPRREIIRESLINNGKIFIVRSLNQGIELVNELAPEHLEIITKAARNHAKKIQHAGSIFLGNYSPVALGDYFAGPNHVLPTGRTARFSSPLTVDDFVTKSSVTQYSKNKMERSAEKIALFAEREGLTAHALSLRLRGAGKK